MAELLGRRCPKVLWVLPECPYPPESGPQWHSFGLLKLTSQIGICRVVGYYRGEEDLKRWRAFQRAFPAVKVEKLGARTKGYKRAGKRVRRMLLGGLRIMAEFENRDLEGYLKEQALNGQYDLINFASFEVSKLHGVCRRVPSVLVPYDAFSLRNYRQMVYSKDWRGWLIGCYRYLSFRRLERIGYPEFSVVCPVSDVDSGWLRRTAPQARVMTVGIPIGQEFMGERRYPRERRYVLCGAIFNYDWMAQPIIECIRELAPYLRANHSDVEIVCLGKRPTSATLKAIGAMAGVRHIEWVPDYRRMVQDAFLYIYPNRCVSGIQTKIQQAMASGVPVVSTAEVLEAIGAVDGEHAIQCDSAEDICRKVEPLLQDRELWERISSNGRQLILHKYGEEAVMLQLKRAYATALGGSCSESGQDDAELA